MGRTIHVDKHRSLVELEILFDKAESAFGPLQSIGHGDDHTLATFGGERRRGGGLRLVLDPRGEAAPSGGAEPVCRGTLYVEGRLAQVIVFRLPLEQPRSAGARVDDGPPWPKAGAGDELEGSAPDESRPAASDPRNRKAAGVNISDMAPWPKAGAGDELEGSAPDDAPDGSGPQPAETRDAERTAETVAEEARRLVLEETARTRRFQEESAAKDMDHKSFLEYLRGDQADEPGVEPPATGEYRVWFGTDRKPVDPADPSRGFSGARGGTTRYGYCDVFVPESHKIGSIGSSALRRLLTWTDDRLKLREIAGLEAEAYWAAVAAQVGELEPGKRHAVVFIHGYNVSFEEAAIRAAQIGFDLGVGAMAFFSWPSKGELAAYKADSDTIENSEGAIADFLTHFAQRSGADAVHVIVHSMGNKGVARAMKEILADAERRGGCRFGQIILAAADVDAELFGRLAGAYKALAARTTLYVSRGDLALRGSAWLADYPRVGFYPPVSVFDGIDTVSVSSIDLTLLGHGYVGEARPVLDDMRRLIFDGTPPPGRSLERRENEEGKAYWAVGA